MQVLYTKGEGEREGERELTPSMELLICCHERTPPTNVRHDPLWTAAVVWNALCGSDYVLHMYVGLYGYVLYDTMLY